MRRVLPYPLLWLSLFSMWLLLNGSFGLGHILLGAMIATIACLAARTVLPASPRIGRVGAIFELLGIFLLDVIRSNINVVRLTLSGRTPRSAFVRIPLDLVEPTGLAILAAIVTATPGSAWIEYEQRSSIVTIHILDTEDDMAWVATLRSNYEKRLLEIFQ